MEAREHKTQALMTDRMRVALIKWASAVLESNWPEALRLIGLIEQQWLLYDFGEDEDIELPLFLEDTSERYAAGTPSSYEMDYSWTLGQKLF